MEYSIKPKRLGERKNNPLPSKEDNWIIRELIEMTKSYYAEAKLAYETQARYWNPYYSGVGYESLKLIKQL